MVSVVLTAYNTEEYIAEAIASVIGQSYKDLELIIVNDASTDNTEEIAREFAKKDDRIKIVSNIVNKGAGMARAIGISNAKGEYVIFIDSDDFFSKDYIKHLADEAKRTDADITSGGVTILKEDGTKEVKTYGTKTLHGDAKVLDYWGENIVYMNNRLIKRAMFEKVPYCKRRYIEDTPTIIPLLWYANKVAFVEDAGYYYRMRGTSLTHTADTFKDVIFRLLCILDLLDFFNEHDKSMIDKIKLPESIGYEMYVINNNIIHKEDIDKYKDEWLEIIHRTLNYIQIVNIDYNPKKQKT